MPTKDLVQVVSYITPALKKLVEAKIASSEYRLSTSGYIALLISRDMGKKRVA